jgi:hypothetical protein
MSQANPSGVRQLKGQVRAISGHTPGAPGLMSLDLLRGRRNQAEYPDPRGYDPIAPDDADDAIAVTAERITSADDSGNAQRHYATKRPGHATWHRRRPSAGAEGPRSRRTARPFR